MCVKLKDPKVVDDRLTHVYRQMDSEKITLRCNMWCQREQISPCVPLQGAATWRINGMILELLSGFCDSFVTCQ